MHTITAVSTRLLLNLQSIDDRRQLRQDLVSLLVVLKLRCNEVGQIAQRFRCVEDLAQTLGQHSFTP